MVDEQIWKKLFLIKLGPTGDPRNPTQAHSLCALHHSNGALKGVDCTEIGRK